MIMSQREGGERQREKEREEDSTRTETIDIVGKGLI
jgi:hypothetical protein